MPLNVHDICLRIITLLILSNVNMFLFSVVAVFVAAAGTALAFSR